MEAAPEATRWKAAPGGDRKLAEQEATEMLVDKELPGCYRIWRSPGWRRPQGP